MFVEKQGSLEKFVNCVKHCVCLCTNCDETLHVDSIHSTFFLCCCHGNNPPPKKKKKEKKAGILKRGII